MYWDWPFLSGLYSNSICSKTKNIEWLDLSDSRRRSECLSDKIILFEIESNSSVSFPLKEYDVRHDLKYECMSDVDFPMDFSVSNKAVDHDFFFFQDTAWERGVLTLLRKHTRLKVCLSFAREVSLKCCDSLSPPYVGHSEFSISWDRNVFWDFHFDRTLDF